MGQVLFDRNKVGDGGGDYWKTCYDSFGWKVRCCGLLWVAPCSAADQCVATRWFSCAHVCVRCVQGLASTRISQAPGCSPGVCRCQTCPLLASASAAQEVSAAAGEAGWLQEPRPPRLLYAQLPIPHVPFSLPYRCPAAPRCFKRKCSKPVRGSRFDDKPAFVVRGATTYAACCKVCRTSTGCVRFGISARSCAIYRTKPNKEAVRAAGHHAVYCECAGACGGGSK